MPVARAEEITQHRLLRIDRERTICFQPVSALEVHGPHLPLGMDLFMASWMAEEAGRRFADRHPDWLVVQMPPLPIGADELPLPGSMNTPAGVLHRAVLALGRSLARAGHRHVVITNGHGGPRHAAGIEAACRRVSRETGISMYSPSIAVLHRIVTGGRLDAVEGLIGRALHPAERAGLTHGEHGGTWETSFLLADRPELVEPVWRTLPQLAAPPFGPLARLGRGVARVVEAVGGDPTGIRFTFDGLAGSIGWLLNLHLGRGGAPVTYHGDPSAASAEIGGAFRELLAADCLEIVEDVVAGRRRAAEVRSVASDPLVIQPDFWKWVGAGAAAMIALAVALR